MIDFGILQTSGVKGIFFGCTSQAKVDYLLKTQSRDYRLDRVEMYSNSIEVLINVLIMKLELLSEQNIAYHLTKVVYLWRKLEETARG